MTVRDDGPGIPPMEVTVVEAGQETPLEHGTGLGLWLVNWTVTQYGGCFQFSVDDGTVATLRLPAIGAEQSVEDAARRRCYGSRSELFVRPAVLPVGTVRPPGCAAGRNCSSARLCCRSESEHGNPAPPYRDQMEVQFLGGADEIGRSAVLVDDRLLLDYGMASESPPQYPVGDVDPEAVVVSHGHLDHAGAVPALMASGDLPPVHWTPPTRELATTLAEDTLKLHGSTPRCPFTETDVQRLTQASETHGYEESFDAAGYEITLYNAGHIPGSAHVLVDDGDTRLLYTGDFHTGDQRLVAPSSARPDADAVICESTYSDVSHGPRDTVEQRFAESVQQTVWEGGTVVVPAFAIGRTQEAMLVCNAHDIDCYLDGMGQRVTKQLKRHPEFLRDADALRGATSSARFVTGRNGQRERIAEQNTVIITTSGMLNGGPAMTYVPAIRHHPTNKVALTGYQVEGTPGRQLLDTGSAELDGRVMPVSAQVELHEFSAHADRDGLVDFLDAYRETPILAVHGDRTAAFAAELRGAGFDASAPELGDTVSL